MRILSFDIGIKNLAFCELSLKGVEKEGEEGEEEGKDFRKYEIHDWDVCDISIQGKKHDINLAVQSIIDLCKQRFQGHIQDIDCVVIENQPVMKNPIMKSIQMVIFTFFHMMKKDHNEGLAINLTSATNKNKIVKRLPELQAQSILTQTETDAKSNKGYKYNKKLADNVCRIFLEEHVLDIEKWCEIYSQHKKKDDLADAFLQGVHFIPM